MPVHVQQLRTFLAACIRQIILSTSHGSHLTLLRGYGNSLNITPGLESPHEAYHAVIRMQTGLWLPLP